MQKNSKYVYIGNKNSLFDKKAPLISYINLYTHYDINTHSNFF